MHSPVLTAVVGTALLLSANCDLAASAMNAAAAPNKAGFDWQNVKAAYLQASRPIMDGVEQDGDLLARQFARQAVLIAVRRGLGLPTRDQALGDPAPKAADGEVATLRLATTYYSPKRLELQLNRHEGERVQLLWTKTVVIETPAGQYDYIDLVAKLEALSRGEIVEALRKAGMTPSPTVGNGKADADPAGEALLDRFGMFQQFDALRRLHARIRAEGEGVPELQGLIRGYAILAQHTQYHWTLPAKSCQARALLYSHRLAEEHGVAAVRWHRA